MTLGIVWAYGNLTPYIASYLAYESSATLLNAEEYQNYLNTANYCFFVQMTAVTLGCVLGGRSETYFGPKRTILMSSLFVSIGFGATFFCIDNIYSLLLSYGVV